MLPIGLVYALHRGTYAPGWEHRAAMEFALIRRVVC